MSSVDLPTDYNPWDATIGPNGIPRISIGGSSPPVDKSPSLPLDNQTNYIMEQDLTSAQQGKVDLPPDVAINDAGIPFNKKTGREIPVIPRPNVLPVAKSPDGYTFAWPKMADIVGNVMAPLAAGSVPVKAGEMVLGSGMVRTAPEVAEAAKEPFYSTLAQAVDNAKIGKASADQWLGYLKNQPGVKVEEIGQVLSDLPQGQITKEAMQGIVNQNAVKLGEVVKGGDEYTQYLNKLEKKYNTYGNDLFEKMTTDEYKKSVLLQNDETKYHDYQLIGGENYKEMLLTLPQKITPDDIINKYGVINSANKDEISPAYLSSHWNEPNILAHVRMNDRNIPDIGKSLHLEEIQSDWHQAGRKQGYIQKDLPELKANADTVDQKLIDAKAEDIMGNPDLKAGLKDAVDRNIINQKEADDYLRLTQNENSTIPDAPFKTTWPDLAFKRMLHKAANEGYDAVSWTPGEAQAARYDLSKQVDNLQFKPDSGELVGMKNGKGVIKRENITPDKLPDLIGKEASEKLLKTKQRDGVHVLIGDDLKIGGEGMKSFYDKMLVDKANALAKKFGGKVESKNLEVPGGIGQWKYEGPDRSIDELSKIYQSKKLAASLNAQLSEVLAKMGAGEPYDKAIENYGSYALAEKLGGKLNPISKGQPIHVLKLTPELKARAKQGFPLFSSTPILNPVNFNPFDQSQSNYKLTPVQGNPFQ